MALVRGLGSWPWFVALIRGLGSWPWFVALVRGLGSWPWFVALVRGLLGIGLVTVVGKRMEIPAGVFNTTNLILQSLNPFVVFILYSYGFFQYVVHCIHRTWLVKIKCQCQNLPRITGIFHIFARKISGR